MIQRVDDYHSGSISLGRLVMDLRGLYEAADVHSGDIRSGFESYWSPPSMVSLNSEPRAGRLQNRPATRDSESALMSSTRGLARCSSLPAKRTNRAGSTLPKPGVALYKCCGLR